MNTNIVYDRAEDINKKKCIIYAGDYLGYNNTAMQVHAINIAKIFESIGYSVVFVSFYGWKPDMNKEVFCTPSGESFHCYYTIDHPIPNNIHRKLYRQYHSISGNLHYKRIIDLASKYGAELIIYYGYISVKNLVKNYRKNRIPILIDRTDWFDYKQAKDLYTRKLWAKHTERCIQKWSTFASGMIAISPFFYDYYKDKLPTIMIPALADIHIDSYRDSHNRRDEVFRIVYTGTPGRKDLLKPIIDAVNQINKEKLRIYFDIVGITYYGDFTEEDAVNKGIRFHGVVSHEKAMRIVAQSDCSVLLRKNERYAKAGFSTKFSESMTLGVPVLCTKVGGADECIKDNENGFLISDNEVDTVKSKLESIINMTKDDLFRIKHNAALYGKEHFCYKSYVDEMREFLDKYIFKKRQNTEMF